MIYTGAGVSAASGIPTFEDESWKNKKKYAGRSDPKKILTNEFFQVNPMAVWEWSYDFQKLMNNKMPNEAHKAIASFQEFCMQSNDLFVHLVTQNFDGLHDKAARSSEMLQLAAELSDEKETDSPFCLEICGNAGQMISVEEGSK